MALFSQDTGLLGTLSDSLMHSIETALTDRYFTMLVKRGLLRDDVPRLDYSFQAVSTGFWLMDTAPPDPTQLNAHSRADALAHTIRHAFEPVGEPAPDTITAAANEVVVIFEDLLDSYQRWIFSSTEWGRP